MFKKMGFPDFLSLDFRLERVWQFLFHPHCWGILPGELKSLLMRVLVWVARQEEYRPE